MNKLLTHFGRSFIFTVLLLGLLVPFAYAQETKSKRVKIDPDWERIRDVQVQMLKKKERELDLLKEELLSRAQPQTVNLSEELEKEIREKEVAWENQLKQYENEITLLRIKAEDQKKELDKLRSNESADKSAGFVEPSASLELNERELKERENQISQKEQELNNLRFQFESEKKEFEKRAEEQMQQKLKARQIEFDENQKALEMKEKELERVTYEYQKQIEEFDEKIAAEQERLDQEREALAKTKQNLESDKLSLMKERENMQQQMSRLTVAQQDEQGFKEKEASLVDRERQLIARENILKGKIYDANDREERIALSQKQLVDERRQWQIKKSKLEEEYEERFAKAQKQLEEIGDFEAERTRIRNIYEKQLSELQNEINAEKEKWAKKESQKQQLLEKALRVQKDQEDQIKEFKSQLEFFSVDAKETDELSQRIQQASKQLELQKDKVVELQQELDEQKKITAEQQKAYEKVLQTSSELEEQLEKIKQEKIEAKSHAANLSQKQDFDSNIEELRKQLEVSRLENDKWRKNRSQDEKAWSEFVNRETELHLELKSLKRQLASKKAPVGRDWSKEAKDIVVERKELSRQKMMMVRKLTQERQKFEQEKADFLKKQKEFEEYMSVEKAKLEQLRG